MLSPRPLTESFETRTFTNTLKICLDEFQSKQRKISLNHTRGYIVGHHPVFRSPLLMTLHGRLVMKMPISSLIDSLWTNLFFCKVIKKCGCLCPKMWAKLSDHTTWQPGPGYSTGLMNITTTRMSPLENDNSIIPSKGRQFGDVGTAIFRWVGSTESWCI